MTSEPILCLATPKVYETVRLRLTSPLLRIGSAVSELNPYEYVQKDDHVYLPNIDALARALKQRGYLELYIQAISAHQNISDLLIQAFGEDWPTAHDDQGRSLFPAIRQSQKHPPGVEVSKLRPMIRNGMGQFYLPGSSIKGAIRTAIAYSLLNNAERYGVPEKSSLSHIEETLRQKIEGGDFKSRWQQKKMDDALFMDELFSNYGLSCDDRSVRARRGPNTDIFRALQVSDSQPLLSSTTEDGLNSFNQANVVEVLVSSHFAADSNEQYPAKCKNFSFFAEVVRNLQTEFTLSLDTHMLSWFRHQNGMVLPFQSVDDILQMCQEFAQAQWQGESNYWRSIKNNDDKGRSLNFDPIRDFYSPTDCPWSLRLGWGSGITGTTIGWLLNDELRADLRDACGKEAKGYRAPKSRRTVLDAEGKARWALGWVKFEVISS